MKEGDEIAFVYHGQPRYGTITLVDINRRGERYVMVMSDGIPKCYTYTKMGAIRVMNRKALQAQ